MSTAKETGKIGSGAAASIVVSNMVGAGIFTTSGFLIANLGSPELMLAVWLIGGLLALAGAVSYGELGASLPSVGGDYVYLREAYGPLWAFLSGWMSFFAGFGAPIAITALGTVAYFTVLFPVLQTAGHEPFLTVFGLGFTLSPGHLVALSLVWFLTLFHWTGIRMSGRFHTGITLLNLVLITFFIVLALTLGEGSWDHIRTGEILDAGEKFPALAVSLVIVMYAYMGFNAAAYVAGEIRDPGRNLPRALIAGTAIVVVLYLALNLVFIFGLDVDSMSGRIDVAGIAAAKLFGERSGRVISILIGMCVLASCSSMICIAPRIYYTMARDRALPGYLATVSSRFGTPGRAFLLQGAWVSLLVLAGSFEQLLTYCGFMLSLFSALSISAVFVLRRKRPDLPRPYRARGYPFTPVFFIALALWMMLYVVFTKPFESLVGLIIVGLGAPVFLLHRAWRNKKGPEGRETGK